jgi:hypothetical protein
MSGERYISQSGEVEYHEEDRNYFESLKHIEHIVNGLEGESGILLYLRHDQSFIRRIAKKILKEGRQSVMFCYYKQEYCENGTNPGLKGYPGIPSDLV